MIPAITAIGNDTLPTTTIDAIATAAALRHWLKRGRVPAHRLEHAPEPVEEMDPEGDVADDVEDRHG